MYRISVMYRRLFGIVVVVLFLIAAAIGGSVLYTAWPTFVQSDTVSAERFRFSNYSDGEVLLKDLQGLFPIGTTRSYVEAVLVDAAGAKVLDYKNGMVQYVHAARFMLLYVDCPMGNKWSVRFFYSKDNRVEKMKLNGPCG